MEIMSRIVFWLMIAAITAIVVLIPLGLFKLGEIIYWLITTEVG